MNTSDNIRINGERLWASLMELARIGATAKGGVCRLTLTDLDKQARDLVIAWARQAGMTVTIDKIGNCFMRRSGRNDSLPPVMTGSHIDTQPTGGKTSAWKPRRRSRWLSGAQEPGDHPVGAYFEAHIEQGPVLEDNDKTIGVVQGVLGIRWFDCTVTGMEAHAGPTPMALRKDALQVALKIMQEVVAAALRHQPHGRGTVGMVQVHPNSRNVIPGQVRFSIDLRNASDELVDRMAAEVSEFAARAARDSGLDVKMELVSSYPAQPFHIDCIAAVARAATKLGYSSMPAVSGAGHDAVYMARLAPAGMIFIPCKDGISHNEVEDARADHVAAGCNVLLHAMLERAGT